MKKPKLKGPSVVTKMVFWNSEFLGVIDAQGNILKFDSEDGSNLIWGCVGEIITVLEWAVQLSMYNQSTLWNQD